MSASLGLFRLQQVDSQIDRIKTRLDAIQQIINNNAELKSARAHFEKSNDENILALHRLKTAENDVKGLKIKIEQAEASLYGGGVKNPKELQDLQKEIESLKRHLNTLEERELEALLLTENTGNDVQSSKSTLDVIQTQSDQEHVKLLEERTKLIAHMESLTQEREAALAPIDQALLATYEDLRKQKRGVAIAEVDDNACTSCGTDLNAALQQNARSQKQLAHCPSCGRILFAK